MRALFSSSPGAGHVQPMLPLALRMRQRGAEVVWATGEGGTQWAQAAGLETVTVGLPGRDRLAEYFGRWPEARSLRGEALASHMFPRLFGVVGAPTTFPGLLALARRWQPDVIVSEAAELAAPVVAAALGVVQVTHGFGLVVPAERVQHAAELAAPLWDHIGLAPRPFGGCYDHLYVDVYPPSLQPEDLSYIGRIQRRRPESHTARGDGVPAAVRALAEDGRPLVYLTFGTVFNDNPAFAAAVDALRAMEDVVAVVTVGPEGDPGAFGTMPDHVVVERYVSQADLLPHTTVAVSHTGSGTFLGALAAGVPHVCLPQAADQFRNADACVRAGAGVSLVGDAVTAEAVDWAVRSVIADPAYRAGAGRVAAEIASMPSVDDTAAVIERLAEDGPAGRTG